MKTNTKSSSSGLWIVLTLGFAALSALLGFRLYSASDSVAVASVNGEKITKTAVYERMVKQGGKEIVDRIIEETLVNQEAKKNNVTVSEADVNAEISKIKERIGGEEKFKAALTQYGVTLPQLKEDTEFQLKVKKLLLKDVKITDKELQEYFEKNRAQYDEAEQVKARHILVKTEQEAKDIKAQLDKGADFAKLASEKSEDPGSKAQGGDLGFFGKGQMVPEFDKYAFSAEKGKISDPIKTDFGFHIIQVTDKKAEKKATFESVKAKVTEAFQQEKVREGYTAWLEALKAKASITNTLDVKAKS